MPSSRLLCCTILLSLTLVSAQAWSWGTKGHETVEEVAAHLLPRSSFSQLLKNNIGAVKFMSMVPDLHWKHGTDPHPIEGQCHFFAVDYYSPRGGAISKDINELVRQHGMQEVLKNGTAPFRMEQMSALLLNVMKNPKVKPAEIIQIAATLGHYVGDLGNPLHTSIDYDGQQIGLRGLHAFFETYSVNEITEQTLKHEVADRASHMLQSIPNNVNPLDGGMMLAVAGHKRASVIYGYAERSGLTPTFATEMRPTIYSTLAMSAAMLAKIWNEAYVLAGSPELDTSVIGQVPVPEWVPVSYLKGAGAFFDLD